MRVSKRCCVLSMVVGLLMLGTTSLSWAQEAQAVSSSEAGPITSQDYDELFQRFLDAARKGQQAESTHVDYGWMSDLSLDVKARRVNDIVTVRVIESISGSGAADSALGVCAAETVRQL